MKKPKRKPARRFFVGTIIRQKWPCVWGKTPSLRCDETTDDATGCNNMMTRKEAEALSGTMHASESTILELVPVKR